MKKGMKRKKQSSYKRQKLKLFSCQIRPRFLNALSLSLSSLSPLTKDQSERKVQEKDLN